MAKKTTITEPIQRVKIHSAEFTGYLDEMPEEVKAELIKRNPKAAKAVKKVVKEKKDNTKSLGDDSVEAN